jgi:MFS transporter, DHA1 family, multidrug resistance protein
MIVVLGLLSTFGPFSLDLYLPALPQLAEQLHASASGAQLSITACLLGLATGQLVAGPLSDRRGRRGPLIVGLALYLVTSAACAFATSIAVLVLLRLLQGLAGSAGIVIARAVARDLYGGRELVIFFSRLILIAGVGPVIAPVAGGQLSRIMSWRGMFGVLAGFGAVLLVVGVLGVRETLPPERRTVGGLRATMHGFRVLLRDRLFMGSVLSTGFAGASMFAYIAGSTFVLQRIYGLSASTFSLVFATNSLGLVAAGQIGGRLVRRHPPLRVLQGALLVNCVGAIALAISVLARLGFVSLIVSLFVMVSSIGMIMPTASALALADHPERAGAASSLLGLAQFIAGAAAAPLVGIAGETSAVPMGVVALGASLAGNAVFAGLVVPAVRAQRRREPPPEAAQHPAI